MMRFLFGIAALFLNRSNCILNNPISSSSIMECPANFARTVQLNDGNFMPIFGLGVYQSRKGEETYNAVLTALRNGV
jgi:hypothetical protein